MELRHGDLRLTLAPELGGSVLSLTHAGRDLLRPAPAAPADVLETACFPLVPYANRIAEGRFSFAGRSARLADNMAGQAHPLHGDGWRGVWSVQAQGPASASLSFEAGGDGWPWAYRARQDVELTASGLRLGLEVVNLSDGPAPFGLGFHPYFPHAATARLTAQTTGVWEISPDILPVRHAPAAPWASTAAVRSDRLIDHCYTGWDGTARIDLGAGQPSLALTASPEMGWLHVYSPPDQDIFCVEPVSHAPNALNMEDPEAQGIAVVAPGERFGAWMRLDLA